MRCVVASLLVAAIWLPVGAQEAEETEELDVIPVDTDPEPRSGTPVELDDMVVTATKREKPAREVPGTVTSLDGAALEAAGAREQEDFLRLVPGVSLYKGEPDRQRLTIRGIAADNGTSQAVGTLINDVPFTDPFIADLSPDLAPFDLERVEVLKGPTGTLFGASGLAGAVRYLVQPAALDEWQARGFMTGAGVAHGDRAPAYGVALNAPLHERLALRVVGTQWHRAGLVDETGRGEPDVDASQQDSYRALLRFVPTDRLDVRAMHLAQKTITDDLGFVDNLEGRLDRDSTPTASPGRSQFSLDELTLNYDFDWATLTSASGRITKLLDIDADTSRLAPGTRQFALVDVDGYTQELRLASPDRGAGDWQWLVGAFFMHYDTFRRVDLTTDQPSVVGTPLPQAPFIPGTTSMTGGDTGLLARFDLDATAREIAVFGEATYEVLPDLDATLGLRAYRTSSEGVATASGALTVVLTGQQESRNPAELQENGFSPKVALNFHWTEDVMIYGVASRGFRFGGLELIGDTPTDDIPATYKSDSVWLYEGGVRTRWLQRTLAADASVYQMDWKDPQLTQITESGTLLYIDNVGAARVQGAELALRYLTPLPGLTLGATGAYTDARTTEPFTASSDQEIPAGARWPYTAERQVAADATYALQFGAWSVVPSVVYAYTGKGYSNIENTVPLFDYETLDAHLAFGYDAIPGAPTLSVSATNLLDRRGVASDTFAADSHTVYYIRPFTVSAQVVLRF